MRRLELGLTDHERRVRDSARRARNCAIAIAAIFVLGSVLLNWSV